MKKDRLFNTYIPTIVVDEFFETPVQVRSFALQQEYFKGPRGHWPGMRSDYLEKLDQDLCDVVMFNILQHLPQFKKFETFESTFQLINENYVKGWIHDDAPNLNVAGFVYLYPNAPEHSGTSFFGDDGISKEQYVDIWKDDVLSPPERPPRVEYEKYREDHASSFTKQAEIDHVFNRCVIFDPKVWHSADNFFGTTKDNTRLTLVFFGKAV